MIAVPRSFKQNTGFIFAPVLLFLQNCLIEATSFTESPTVNLPLCESPQSARDGECVPLARPMIKSPLDGEVTIDRHGKVRILWDSATDVQGFRITVSQINLFEQEILNIESYQDKFIEVSVDVGGSYLVAIEAHTHTSNARDVWSAKAELRFTVLPILCDGESTQSCFVNDDPGVQRRTCVQGEWTEFTPCVDNLTVSIGDSMIRSVDSRLVGKNAAEAMPLLKDVTDRGDLGIFIPNPDLWAADLRAQFTGVHMNAGAWGGSYGLQAITPRHAISCGHNGPGVNNRVRYVNVDGTVFETKILKWINDFPTPQRKQDLSVYLLADPLPEWVYKAPIVSFSSQQIAGLNSMNAPIVAISQGYDVVKNPSGRKLYVRPVQNKWPMLDLRAPFWHNTYVGDSGTPQFALIQDKLYLFAITLYSGINSGIQVGNHIDYINEMIGRADAAADISTGYTVQNAVLPDLN
jgi:hypothetical protein